MVLNVKNFGSSTPTSHSPPGNPTTRCQNLKFVDWAEHCPCTTLPAAGLAASTQLAGTCTWHRQDGQSCKFLPQDTKNTNLLATAPKIFGA